VHDLVDFAAEEARRCGESVCRRLSPSGGPLALQFRLMPGANVKSVVPNSYAPGRENVLYLRPLVVKNHAVLEVRIGSHEVLSRTLAHTQPSEMVRLVLRPADFPSVDAGGDNSMEVSLR
jgi:hypothetical protein